MGSGVERILLGVTGGIAAYKSAEIVRRLRERGAEVQVVMTGAARQFVTPLTFQALSGRPVRTDLWDEAAEAAMGHIELARWADRILVAPASADFLARLAHGLASDLLTTLCLATDAPIIVAPAMNRLMWANAATRANMALLAARGIDVIGPAEGDQACGETGPGRMVEPDVLAAAVIDRAATSGALAGRKVIVTAGPTRERIDPVRFITNRSSGKMGFAVAEAARDAGAEVILISGPVNVCTPRGVRRVDVETADQMLAAVNENLGGTDIFIAAAAVSDYRPVQVLDGEDQEDERLAHARAQPHDGHPRHGGRRRRATVRGRVRSGDPERRAQCARQARGQEPRHDRGQPGGRGPRLRPGRQRAHGLLAWRRA